MSGNDRCRIPAVRHSAGWVDRTMPALFASTEAGTSRPTPPTLRRFVPEYYPFHCSSAVQNGDRSLPGRPTGPPPLPGEDDRPGSAVGTAGTFVFCEVPVPCL